MNSTWHFLGYEKKNTISFLVAKDVLLLTILLYIYNGGETFTLHSFTL